MICYLIIERENFEKRIFENFFENDFNSGKVVNVHMIQNHLTVRVARTTFHVHVFGHMKTDVATVSGSVQKLTQETTDRFVNLSLAFH